MRRTASARCFRGRIAASMCESSLQVLDRCRPASARRCDGSESQMQDSVAAAGGVSAAAGGEPPPAAATADAGRRAGSPHLRASICFCAMCRPSNSEGRFRGRRPNAACSCAR
jgi:hypothetical protein